MAASSSTAASPSTSTSAAGNPINKFYHVFLNHRGVDVKKTFARSLYLRLVQNGLTAFLDNEEIKAGYDISSQLEHAISTASVHVAIFTPRYAESQWCLDELIHMLKTNAPIIPVFYHVKPDQVRRSQGSYGDALQTRENKLRHNSKTIEDWRNALFKVANNSGFELETCNGEELEMELVNKVVKRVLEMVKKTDLYVAEHPTGLDYKLKHFEDTIQLEQQQSGKRQILGIVGLGGAGKTTLAKEFFNRNKSQYHRSSFLSDIRDHAAKGSLNSLQKILLKDLERVDNPIINTVYEGQSMLVEPLKSSVALVILDDVDHVDQVKALLPVQASQLNSGSLILITSRDNRVLIASKLVEHSSIYRLTGLNHQYSKELFCNHAFNQPYPLPGFEYVVDKFLKSCEGLPLSLKVFGALLYERDISDWEDELRSLQQILPEDIHKAFIRSYNSLNKEEKNIFLDIACYFIGQNRDTAIAVWDRSGWRGRRGFQNLQNKCLVEVDRWNRICMHDHVRDLRIEVAEDSKPRRIWRWTNNVIDDLSSSEIIVRGIRMVRGKYNGHDEDEDNEVGVNDTENTLLVRNLRRLQILHIENALLEGILRRVKLTNLIWFRWINCPHSSLPSWVPLKNLRVLQVNGSALKSLWHREGESQGSLSLPIYLEELRATECVKLKNISGLASLEKLRILYVDGCSELEELPSMETLVSLEDLCTNGCVKLKNINGLASLKKLCFLDVSGCSELEELPSMETLVSLEDLRTNGCVKLKAIRGLAPHTKLRILHVDGCSELEELPSMDTLVSLEELGAGGCGKLKAIRGLAPQTKLRILYVDGCSELEELPRMETLVSLEDLRTNGCVKLKAIRGLAPHTKLRILHVDGCSELEELPSMETLVSLEQLGAGGCGKLKAIRGLAPQTKLRILYVDGCSELEELPRMETLVSLEDLRTNGCVKLKAIRGLAPQTKLRIIYVKGCSELEELPSMETLVSLEELRTNGCVKLKAIRGLAPQTKLRILDVDGCSELEELPSMETLVSLEGLCTNGCVKLKAIRGLAPQTKLRILYVDGCSELVELPSMETLVSLEKFSAQGCFKLGSIKGLALCTKLRMLTVRGCSELEEVEGVEHMSLEIVDMSMCPKLRCPVWE